MTATGKDFVGRGLAFPVHTDATGSIALVGGEREVVESIRLILATAPGERPMRPEFGCAVHDLVFAPADAATAGQIAYEVRLTADGRCAEWIARTPAGEVRYDAEPRTSAGRRAWIDFLSILPIDWLL